MKYLTATWKWVMKHSVGIIIGCLVLVYVLANTASIQAKTQVENSVLSCRSLCFPQQSEYISNSNEASCWCYTDQKTMKKSE